MQQDLDQLLADAHLRYADLSKAGYQRQRRGGKFVYISPSGETVRDKKLIEWINSLVIPPAWEDVWISPQKNSHILAVGRDAKGRKQYRYHPRWQSRRSQNKFSELAAFGRALPSIRKTVDKHLKQPEMTKQKVLAVVVHLLEATMIRVGNTEYMKQNKTFGLTTLKDKHVTVDGSTISFEFVGKSKVQHTVTLQDRRLARAVKACRELPGYELFQYVAEDGTRRTINSADVNAYLNEITGEPFTAKVFRTWGGSVEAIRFFIEQAENEELPPREKLVQACVNTVAALLGNTKAVCRQHYIHPAVINAVLDDTLYALINDDPADDTPYDLRPEELLLMRLLETA
jgi:DNA topoisomerase-1